MKRLLILTLSVMLLFFLISCKKDKNDNNDNSPPTTVTDIDGNVYNIVTIGTQVWMKENLKVTHYRNGDPIPNIISDWQWENDTIGAYCDFYNLTENGGTYGRLYNWYAVNDSRKIAPSGWHVASDDEWKILEVFIGMPQTSADSIGIRGTIEGGLLKESDTTHWSYPNIGATNSSGFTALPGGFRRSDGVFFDFKSQCFWWTSTEKDVNSGAYYRSLNVGNTKIARYYTIEVQGHSVRCIKD